MRPIILGQVYIQLSHIPHYTTLQKFAATVSGTILERIISSFTLLLSNIRRLFIGIIDSSGFKVSIQCFTILYRQSKPTQEISKIINWSRGTISDSMFYQDKESSNKTRYHRLSANCRKNIRNPTIISSCCCCWQRIWQWKIIIRLWENLSMHLVLYQLDIDMYQSGEHMVNTEKRWNVVTPKYCIIRRETRMKP